MREGLSDVHRDDRTSILATLNNNIALCFFNLGNFGEALKFASTAVTKDPSNSKAHFLKYRSNKEKGDLDSANESIKEAIKLEPSNLQFRNEYTLFIEMKLKKEKAWRSKMEGFLHTDKFKKIEKDDEEEQKIRGKVWTKMERESKIEEQEQEINEKEISDYIQKAQLTHPELLQHEEAKEDEVDNAERTNPIEEAQVTRTIGKPSSDDVDPVIKDETA